MIPVKGLFEAHITVSDMQRSIAFYCDVVGLEVGLLQPERPAAFFWVGGRGRSMMGLFTLESWPLTMKQQQHHVAFQVTLEDVLTAPERLRSVGVTPFGGGENRSTSQSSLLGCRLHPYSSMVPMEMSWNTSPCCLKRHVPS